MNLRKEDITKEEKEILVGLLNKERSKISPEILAILIFSLIFIFLPGRGKRLSMYNEYGFWVAFPIVLGIGLILIFFDKKEKIEGLKKDIASEEKIVEILKITDKDTSLKDEYFIKTDSTILTFQKIIVQKEEFSQLKIDQEIVLEYGENSKTLFNINLNIK